MVKRATKKQRGAHTRFVKRMIVTGLEGKNVTEKQYLNHFNSLSSKYRIIFSKGNSSDPVGVVVDTINSLKSYDFDFELGDKAFCLIDTDYGRDREKSLIDAIDLAKKNNIDVLLTNPTFEIWFLLHFKYSTRQYSSNEDVIAELRRYIPNYEKNLDVFSNMSNLLNVAMENSMKLEDYHDRNGSITIMERCPSSKVFELIKLLLSED